MSASDFRRIAREALKGKWKSVLPIFLLFQLFVEKFALSELREYLTPPNGYFVGGWHVVSAHLPLAPSHAGWRFLLLIAEIMIAIVYAWLGIGIYTVVCRLLEGEKPSCRDLFRTDRIKEGLLLGVISMALYAAVAVVLAVITNFPIIGVCLGCVFFIFLFWIYSRCSMICYLLAKHPEFNLSRALEHSIRTMRGNVFPYICLCFSFAGWMVLQFAARFYFGSFMGSEPAGILLNLLLTVCIVAPLQTYILTACTAFFRYINGEDPENE